MDGDYFYRMRLPHWESKRGIYFVTLRVAGSLPAEVKERLKALSEEAEQLRGDRWLDIQRRIFLALEDALDKGKGVKYLEQPEVAAVCTEAIRYRHRRGDWNMLAYVVMPNHLHLLFHLERGGLYQAMVAFKRWTTGEANRVLDRAGKKFWQREWFDHWSRSPDEDESILAYIKNNPVRAGLVRAYEDWPYGSWNDDQLTPREIENR